MPKRSLTAGSPLSSARMLKVHDGRNCRRCLRVAPSAACRRRQSHDVHVGDGPVDVEVAGDDVIDVVEVAGGHSAGSGGLAVEAVVGATAAGRIGVGHRGIVGHVDAAAAGDLENGVRSAAACRSCRRQPCWPPERHAAAELHCRPPRARRPGRRGWPRSRRRSRPATGSCRRKAAPAPIVTGIGAVAGSLSPTCQKSSSPRRCSGRRSGPPCDRRRRDGERAGDLEDPRPAAGERQRAVQHGVAGEAVDPWQERGAVEHRIEGRPVQARPATSA